MLPKCGVGEDSWESLGLQGDQSWVFIGRTDAEAETPVLWPPHAKSWLIGKDPGRDLFQIQKRCWEGLGAGGEGDDRGWDGWMASPTQWTWVWVNSGSWWWTGRPGVLRFMGSQRVGHDWATERNWPISEKERVGGGGCWGTMAEETVAKMYPLWIEAQRWERRSSTEPVGRPRLQELW